MANSDVLQVALAQIAPVWMDRQRTLEKMASYIEQAAEEHCDLVVFGESILPGYPFWLERTDGARFNSTLQKQIHALYLREAVQVESGHLEDLRELARHHRIAVVFGCAERPRDRGGHSLYASLVWIDQEGNMAPTHRKLVPTYEERLAWSPGDGHGLRVHGLGPFTLGGLNCWENWMPLSRTALYGLGEDLHVALWPGSQRNTVDITRFIALESRSFVLSVSGLMRPQDIPQNFPGRDLMLSQCQEEFLANGGSAIAAPDGSWILDPRVGEEALLLATLDHRRVREERQNFDVGGHYSRPDVTRLTVNRERQTILREEGSSE